MHFFTELGGHDAPEAPTLTGPSAGTYFVGETITLSATTPDDDIDEISFVAYPDGGNPDDDGIVIATDATDPYSQPWAINVAAGSWRIVALAERFGVSTYSNSVLLAIGYPTLRLNTYTANGTETTPANYVNASGVRNKTRVQAWGGGAGGTINVGAGGGGAYAEDEVTTTPSTGYAVGVGAAAAINANGVDTTFDSTTVVAKAGLRGTDGSTGGTAAASTGTIKRSGGDGGNGTGTRTGGAGAGETTAATTSTPGEPNGGPTQAGGTAGVIGGGGGSTAGAATAGRRGEERCSCFVPSSGVSPRWMGFIDWRSTANGTSHSGMTAPTGTVAGEKLLLIVGADGNSAIDVGSWDTETPLVQQNESGNACGIRAFMRTATGDASDNPTITTASSEKVAARMFRLQGAGAFSWTTGQGSSTNVDCPSHQTSPTGNTDIMWIAAVCVDGSGFNEFSAPPSGYEALLFLPPHATDGVGLATAIRFTSSDTENPGVFTNTTEQWAAGTIGVRPA